MTVQVLGLCRFSLLVDGGFQTMHDSLDARRTMLYDPERLELRFAWFEQVCLPALRMQSDPDYTLVLLTGQDLPDAALERLRALTADIPQIVLVQEKPARHRVVCRHAMQRLIDPAAEAVVQFRLDDDDAIAVDFVARLRGDFGQGRGIFDQYRRLYIDYSKGFALLTPPEGVEVIAQIAERMSVGLAVVLDPEDEACVMDFGHHRVHQFMPGLTFQDSYMYLRGKHATNDSTKGMYRHEGLAIDQNPEELPAILSERFGIDLAAAEGVLLRSPC
ncbi:glycosyltransferase [Falsirhodobacter sp. alg1]|uniref:glycosyltransferase n=1 Tax=Falsirhodobacter sp. alg1 TaxID=1472418 RepID=UPI0005EE5CED|nr:glycosyltransferase [Falsirhodobacter sp. alg1]